MYVCTGSQLCVNFNNNVATSPSKVYLRTCACAYTLSYSPTYFMLNKFKCMGKVVKESILCVVVQVLNKGIIIMTVLTLCRTGLCRYTPDELSTLPLKTAVRLPDKVCILIVEV